MAFYIVKKLKDAVIGARGPYQSEDGAKRAAQDLADELGSRLYVEEYDWVPGAPLGEIVETSGRYGGVGITHAWRKDPRGWSTFGAWVGWSNLSSYGGKRRVSSPLWRSWGPGYPKSQGKVISREDFDRTVDMTPDEIERFFAPLSAKETDL